MTVTPTRRNYSAAAQRYAEAVVSGEIAACQWVRKACQRQLDDLVRFKGRTSPYRFNPLLTDASGRKYRPADNLCAFVELLPHIKGPLAGSPITLEPWQVFVLTTIFGWVRRDGGRRFRRSYIEVPRKRGYSAEIIIQKTGLSPKYVKDIVFLLDQGEERLIEGVQRGTIPLTTALEIARANENATEGDGQANLGDLLQEAYENGQLKGRQIIEAKRLIEKRLEHGPASPNRDQIKPPTSSYSLVRTYQREVERQRKMVLKAEHAHQRLLLVVQGLKKLFADEHFVNLLRAEGLDTLPKYLAERINTLGGATALNSPTTPEPEGATT